MLAFWVKDAFEKCLTYPLKGPCEFVYKGEITSFARDIGKVSQRPRMVAQLGVNSYLGIRSKANRAVVGILP